MVFIDRALRYEVDKNHREVRTIVAGAFKGRAVYRDGLGCLVVHGTEPVDGDASRAMLSEPRSAVPLLPDIAGVEPVEPTDERLHGALDRAFAEADQSPYRWTKAVVIVHDGRVVAERYAPGYSADTPLLGHSMTKSVVNALRVSRRMGS